MDIFVEMISNKMTENEVCFLQQGVKSSMSANVYLSTHTICTQFLFTDTYS